MTWTILLVIKNDNRWLLNYLENKLIAQINKYNLQKYVDVVVFQKQNITSDYISVISDIIEISDDYVNVIYNTLKNSNKDCIGLKGLAYVDGKSYKFNQTSESGDEKIGRAHV